MSKKNYNPLRDCSIEQLKEIIKRDFLEATAYAISALRFLCEDAYTPASERRRAATTILRATGYLQNHEQMQLRSSTSNKAAAQGDLSHTPFNPAETIDASTPDALIASIVRALKHPSAPSQGIDTLFHHAAERLKQFYAENRSEVLSTLTRQCLDAFLDPEDIEILLPTDEALEAEKDPQEGHETDRVLSITDRDGRRHIWHLHLRYEGNDTWSVTNLYREFDTS